MRAALGLVSLLAVLLIVGLLASKQLNGTRLNTLPLATGASVPNGAPTEPANVADQSKRLQEQIRTDVNKALEQGARKDIDQ